MARVLDGKLVAETVCRKALLELSLLPVVPKIVFILVGEDPASQTYVRSKTKKCQDLGIRSETVNLPGNVAEAVLLEKIRALNEDKEVHGVLIQLPLPGHINKQKVIQSVNPLKDVDGLHAENVGLLALAQPRLVPCTPAGVIEILKHYQIPIEGKIAVVVGRSEIVGRPMAQLLLLENATVEICHSKTKNLSAETARADILIVAMGRPRFLGAEYVKNGATVIDVGIHRTESGLCGDVKYDEIQSVAEAATPVPGGVGPMTIASLMKNLVIATRLQL